MNIGHFMSIQERNGNLQQSEPTCKQDKICQIHRVLLTLT